MPDIISEAVKSGFFLIAGPCVVESEELCLQVADSVKQLCDQRNIPYVFKASFKKANRLSASSYSGPGLDQGLRALERVKKEFGIPVLTDIHETSEVNSVGEVADILQIPAFLCRQTDLVVAASKTGRWVNIKKGQFLAPEDMGKLAAKADSDKIMLTERGSSFGYRNLVVDFRALLIMAETNYPVLFDATHSLQLPGGGGAVSTGQPQYIIPMARAAVAVGINGLFVETHPEPSKALSDAGAMLPLNRMEKLLDEINAIREARR
ncbi:MAG: 3-deoxy-8-phosphooctulonate synthase [bacterium]|nr:3-deoxy-8-phosphooctulonate synthase [bacterium]